jgi:chromosome segregation ATPase
MSLNSWDQYNQSTPKLLPPTAFERTGLSNIDEHNYSSVSSASPRYGDVQLGKLIGELDKLKTDIGKLKCENENLRLQNRDFVEQAKLCTEISSGHRQISVTTLEEIIHKQALEIQSLKVELSNEKSSHSKKLSDFEVKLSTQSSELQSRDKDMRKLSDNYESKLSEMRTQHEHNLQEKSKRVLDLSAEISELKEKYEQQVAQLRSTIDSLSQEKISILEEKDLKIRQVSEEFKRNSCELENLRSYINESMPTIDKCAHVTQEKLRVEEMLAKERSKNSAAQKEIEALQIRLRSMNEILQIQEAQLEPKGLSVGQKRHNLLNK